ncbi:MAG TPA: dolichol-phosphate mannosyltransferase [Rhodospirillaceae bacterium]|nr:MAG: dolichol-phosphate mannosyltransferase [Alphaproteobacteria bacterium GWF2_58_20]HAU28776.1 dolichol-phosphate mannosyltransferase [Rhodospirillaceae bacterium]
MVEQKVDVSVVVPVHNEEDNILPLVAEIHAALDGKFAFEMVYVNDGSTDGTAEKLREARGKYPMLRAIRHEKACGQSAAVRTGVLHAHGDIICMLDGDGQNDPADFPAMIDILRKAKPEENLGLVAGWRHKRQDTFIRKVSSRTAFAVRAGLLRDKTPDTGCGSKVFLKDVFLCLPFFDHVHRFLPALMRREGYTVVSHHVNHRPRTAGVSKYGVWNRLWVSIADILGVMWLQRRMRLPSVKVEE